MIRKLCDSDQLPEEGKLKAFIDTRPQSTMALCVALLDGVPYAVDNVCPHQHAPLSAGRLEANSVVCPLHGWRWNITDGRAGYAGDPDIASYELRQYGHEVFIRIAAKKVCAAPLVEPGNNASSQENYCQVAPWAAIR